MLLAILFFFYVRGYVPYLTYISQYSIEYIYDKSIEINGAN